MKPTFDDIFNAVLEAAGIQKKIFIKAGASRIAPIMRVRQITCHLAKEASLSTPHIAHKLGIRSWSVTYHANQAKKRLCKEADYALLVDKAMAKLGFQSKRCFIEGWVTRDREEDGGYLYFTIGKEPKRMGDMWFVDDAMMIDLPKGAFPQITWDNAPQKCEMTLQLK